MSNSNLSLNFFNILYINSSKEIYNRHQFETILSLNLFHPWTLGKGFKNYKPEYLRKREVWTLTAMFQVVEYRVFGCMRRGEPESWFLQRVRTCSTNHIFLPNANDILECRIKKATRITLNELELIWLKFFVWYVLRCTVLIYISPLVSNSFKFWKRS